MPLPCSFSSCPRKKTFDQFGCYENLSRLLLTAVSPTPYVSSIKWTPQCVSISIRGTGVKNLPSISERKNTTAALSVICLFTRWTWNFCRIAKFDHWLIINNNVWLTLVVQIAYLFKSSGNSSHSECCGLYFLLLFAFSLFCWNSRNKLDAPCN